MQIQILPACRHDADDLAQLAREQMPEMSALHDPNGWRERSRFGSGHHPRDAFTLAVREAEDGPLLGFFWVDAALADDQGVAEPWWCINAIAIAEQYAGHGLGGELVKIVKERAESAGVTALYGLCYPSSAGFWSKQDCVVGDIEQNLVSTAPIELLDGRRMETALLECEPGNHFFTLALGDTNDGRPRLVHEA